MRESFFEYPLSSSPASSSSSFSDDSLYYSPAECTALHTGQELHNLVIPINVDELYELIFTQTQFIKDFYKDINYIDTQFSDWRIGADSISTSTVTHKTHSFGSTITINNYQKLLECSVPNELYSVDVASISTGTLYDGCFEIHLHYCLQRESEIETLMIITAELIFAKDLWSLSRHLIEKHVWKGLNDFYKELIKRLKLKRSSFKISVKKSDDTVPCRKRRNSIPKDKKKTVNISEESFSDDRLYFSPAECTALHTGQELRNLVIPFNVDELYELIFTQTEFIKDFYNDINYIDTQFSDWHIGPDSISTSTVTHKTHSFGSTITINNYQKLLECSVPNKLYSVDVESISTGTLYDGCFKIHLHYCLQRESEIETLMIIIAELIFTKDLWFLSKRLIENNVWKGLNDFYTELIKRLKLKRSSFKISVKKSDDTVPCRKRRNSIPKDEKKDNIPKESVQRRDQSSATSQTDEQDHTIAKIVIGIGAIFVIGSALFPVFKRN